MNGDELVAHLDPADIPNSEVDRAELERRLAWATRALDMAIEVNESLADRLSELLAERSSRDNHTCPVCGDVVIFGVCRCLAGAVQS